MGAKLSVYNNIAKIWAIRYGLKMAWELRYKEIDSQILLNWLTIYGANNIWCSGIETFYFDFGLQDAVRPRMECPSTSYLS